MHPVNPTPNPYWDPMSVAISNISNAVPAVVTTSVPHTFRDGDAIRTIVPSQFGMTQINGRIFTARVITNISFALYLTLNPSPVPLNSLNFDTYIAATGKIPQIAQAICVGAAPIQNNVREYFETRLDDQVINTLTQSGGSQ